MSLVIEARNYRGLVHIEWRIPPGLSVVVGANGAGKSTLLFLLDLLGRATSRNAGPAPALATYGLRQFRYLGAPDSEPVVLGAQLDEVRWSFEAFPEGGGVRPHCAERLISGDQTIFERPAGSPTVTWKGLPVKTDQRAIIRMLADAELQGGFAGSALLDALSRCRLYYDYDLRGIRLGSEDTSHTSLSGSGQNVFSVLRNWRDRTADRPREDFVINSLRECFSFFGGLDYQKGGKIVEGWVVPRKFARQSFPVMQVANGWLVALLHFTAVAGADRDQVVGIDEFENALHPRAVRNALDLIHAYAEANGVSVVLTTQSAQVLDWFDAYPEKVFVLDRGLRPGPRPITELRSQEWLAHFRLGREFADGDFGVETEG
jgi:predicted ATPase